MTYRRPCHVVQLSLDDSVFDAASGSDMLERQCRYAGILDRRRPGSRLTLLVLTGNSAAAGFTRGIAEFIPLPYFRWWHLPRVYRALKALHRRRPIDIISPQNVHNEGWAAVIFAGRYGIPCLGQIHFDFFSAKARREIYGRGPRGAMRWNLTQRLLPRFDKLRVVGQRVSEGFRSLGMGEKVSVIPVPISIGGAGANCPDFSRRTVLFVGRLAPVKNLDRWLEAARLVAAADPQARFKIVGDGPEAGNLRLLAGKLGLADRTEFAGFIPNRELGAVYGNASVFLLTSHYEGFGRAAAEAQAHGLPVVAPRIAGIEDIVQDGVTGILASPDDAASLADSVLKLLRDPETAARMGRAGRERVRRLFNPDTLAEKWIDLLLETAGDVATEPPLVATWRRWRTVSSTKYSLLRGLEYERLQGLRLEGRTLDLGGGAGTGYRGLLNIDGRLDSLNIDKSIGPSLVGDLNRAFPFADAVFDNIISFNTLEHLSSDATTLSEALRVLKPGGRFHFILPFLYRVHGSPRDYHRHTAYWWAERLTDMGVSVEQLWIEPLVWDPFASGFAISEYEMRPRCLRKRLALLPGVIRQWRWRGWERMPNRRLAAHHAAFALGYYIHGRKNPNP